MNYIAAGIVSFFLAVAVTSGSGTLPTLSTGNLPNIGNQYLLTIIVVILLLVIIMKDGILLKDLLQER